MPSPVSGTRRKVPQRYSRRVSAQGSVTKTSSQPTTPAKRSRKQTTAPAGQASEDGLAEDDVHPTSPEPEDHDARDVVILDHSFDSKTKVAVLHTLRPADASHHLVREDVVQRETPDKLYAYWTSFQQPRENTLGTDEFAVFDIIAHDAHQMKLRVQWVGYPATEDNTTWETASRLRDICPEILDEYLDTNGLNRRLLKAPGTAIQTAKPTTEPSAPRGELAQDDAKYNVTYKVRGISGRDLRLLSRVVGAFGVDVRATSRTLVGEATL